MPLHPQAAAMIEMMAQMGAKPFEEQTPDEARAAGAARARPSSEPIHRWRDVDADGVPCRLYRPSDDPGLGLTVFFHGGGWVIGNLDSHDNVCRILANGSGHAVLAVDYRLAPETKFPGALDDSLTALRWAYEHADDLGCDPSRIAVAGDSAGGNLAAIAAQVSDVPLTFQLLVYPVVDATMSTQSYRDNATGYFLTAASMEWFIDHYLGGTGADPRDPRVSPLYGSDSALGATPPAMVITAQFDPLRDEGDRYAERLAALGVPTNHLRFGGMFHGFFSLGEFVDGGRAANAAAAAALGAALDRGRG